MKTTFEYFTGAAALVALLCSQAQAQDTVIDVFWITETTLSLNALNDYPLAGSVVTADASTTVIAVECTGSSIDTDVCGTAPQTITLGSTTWIASQSSGNLAVTLDCSIAQNSESALCTGGIEAPEAIFTDPLMDTSELSVILTATTADVTSTELSATISSTDFTFLPVTVTAGQDKLSNTGSSSDSSSSSSSGSDSSNEGASGNGAASLQLGLGVGVTGLMAGFVGMMMLVL